MDAEEGGADPQQGQMPPGEQGIGMEMAPQQGESPMAGSGTALPDASDEDIQKFDLDIKDFAQENRKNPTEAENILWQNLRNKRLGYRFRRQHAIGDFIVDFVCIEKKLVVEVDGEVHEKQQEYDEARTFARIESFMETLGLKKLY